MGKAMRKPVLSRRERPVEGYSSRQHGAVLSGASSKYMSTSAYAGNVLVPIFALAVLGNHSQRSRITRRARGGEMFEDLMKEAARLRAEAENMLKEDSSRRAEQSRKVFQAWDLNKNGTIEQSELEQGLKERGLAIDSNLASKILQHHDTNKDGVLQFEEFDERALQASFTRIKGEERDKEFAARKEEMAQARAEKEEKDRITGGLEVENSLLTRAVSTLPYLLPFLTVLQFGTSIGDFFQDNVPPLYEAFVPFFQFSLLWNRMVPLRFVVFLGLLFGSDQERLPLLLRVNMRSAAILDTAIGFAISLWLVITTIFFGGPMLLVEPVASILFFTVMGIMSVSCITSLFGIL